MASFKTTLDIHFKNKGTTGPNKESFLCVLVTQNQAQDFHPSHFSETISILLQLSIVEPPYILHIVCLSQ